MKKEKLLNKIKELIFSEAEKRDLEVVNRGTGRGFDNMVWNGVFKDESEIPEIEARKDNYSITLRSFWESAEIDVRDGDDTLLVLRYSDWEIKNGEHFHTEDFVVSEVRADGKDYKKNIGRIMKMIEFIDV